MNIVLNSIYYLLLYASDYYMKYHVLFHSCVIQTFYVPKCTYFQANNLEISVPVYTGYGKDFMKKHKLHPDTYVQVALQFAYYRLYKK